MKKKEAELLRAFFELEDAFCPRAEKFATNRLFKPGDLISSDFLHYEGSTFFKSLGARSIDMNLISDSTLEENSICFIIAQTKIDEQGYYYMFSPTGTGWIETDPKGD